MAKLSLRTRIRHAAAVFSGRHGAVTRQAQQPGCSRETVYQQARKLEPRLATEPAAGAAAELRAEDRRLRQRIAELERAAEGPARCDEARPRQLATAAFAMGLSLRQIEDPLGILLPAAEAPDHSTLGQWVGAEARRAGAVLAALDPARAPRVRALALDEVFLGGGRPWSASSRRA
jgi:hypothetical protein